jgi:hypothetical protein
MSERVPAALRRFVAERAQHRCEYCRLHEEDALLAHEPDHVIATKHRGETNADNLAWTCFSCNRFKGSDIASVDPDTGQIVRLFHPRRDVWNDHFHVDDGRIVPLTASGRVTEYLLQFNLPNNVEYRRRLAAIGRL